MSVLEDSSAAAIAASLSLSVMLQLLVELGRLGVSIPTDSIPHSCRDSYQKSQPFYLQRNFAYFIFPNIAVSAKQNCNQTQPWHKAKCFLVQEGSTLEI